LLNRNSVLLYHYQLLLDYLHNFVCLIFDDHEFCFNNC